MKHEACFIRIDFKAIIFVFLITLLSMSCSNDNNSGKRHKGRQQWTENEAWEWEKKAGVIKGFNAPMPAYPGMTREDVLKKASELGYNSVRIWLSGKPEEHIEFLRKVLDDAEKYGMTVSPVLGIYSFLNMPDKEAAMAEAKTYVQNLVGEFRNDPRIILWDLWNEPGVGFTGGVWTFGAENIELKWCKEAILWAREVSPKQPLTVSVFYYTTIPSDSVQQLRVEVESMADIHNFHLYDCSVNRMKALDDYVTFLRKIGNRPLVCTEAIARTRGGTFGRTLSAFEKYHIHFFNWGMYTSDANWDVAWDMSSFEPYEPWFHDVLHPDGTPYDWRDLEWVRNFHFAKPGEETDPGAETTERWDKWRAWKWMVSGPVKGLCYSPEGKGSSAISKWAGDLKEAGSAGYNSLHIKLDINEWKSAPADFFRKIDTILFLADINNMRMMPSLLTDADAENPETVLSDYVSCLMKRYGFDPRILAWELYTQPGEKGISRDKLTSILGLIFRVARYEFPNQPLTATPLVTTKSFQPDFDYRKELRHGIVNGWSGLEFAGSSDPVLCNYIWSLSDVISFGSDMKMPETGWLLNIANRYGRPVVCTNWNTPCKIAFKETLELFSRNHVFWFSSGKIANRSMLNSFRFIQISTPRR